MKRPSLAEVLQKAVEQNQLSQADEQRSNEESSSVFAVAISRNEADLIFRALQLFRIDATVNCRGCLSDEPLVSPHHSATCNRLETSAAVNYIRNRAERSGGSSVWFAGGRAARAIYSADNNVKLGLPGYLRNFLQMVRMQYPRPSHERLVNYVPQSAVNHATNYSGYGPSRPLTGADIMDTGRPLFDEGILKEVLAQYAQQQERGTHDGPDGT